MLFLTFLKIYVKTNVRIFSIGFKLLYHKMTLTKYLIKFRRFICFMFHLSFLFFKTSYIISFYVILNRLDEPHEKNLKILSNNFSLCGDGRNPARIRGIITFILISNTTHCSANDIIRFDVFI